MGTPCAAAPPRPKRMSLPRSSRSAMQTLIGQAVWLFRERGYAARSVRDIAARSRIEPSALCYHFSSKDALLQEVPDRSMAVLMADVRRAVDAVPAGASPRARNQAGIAAHLHSHIAHGDFGLAGRHVLGHTPVAIRRQHKALRSAYGHYWQALLAVGAQEASGDHRITLGRMLLIGALNRTSEWFGPRKTAPDTVAEVVCSVLFKGVGSLTKPTTGVCRP